MDLSEMRWELVVVAAAAVFAALFGVRTLFLHQTVDQPLHEVLNERDDVVSHEIRTGENGWIVVVEPGAVDDLAGTFRQLERLIAENIGERTFTLEIRDHRSDRLSKIYGHRLHHHLYEAQSRATYAEAAKAIDKIGTASGLERSELQVDERHLYLHLSDGTAHLYKVIPRREDVGFEERST